MTVFELSRSARDHFGAELVGDRANFHRFDIRLLGDG
jgi:hypothetical protein